MSSPEREPSVLRQLVEACPAMAWAHDADGALLCANPAWRAAAGLPGTAQTATLPQAWLGLMPAYDLVRHLRTFAAALREGLPYAVEHRLAGGTDQRRYVSRAEPIRDAAGRAVAWVGTTLALEEATEPGWPLPRLAGVSLNAGGGPPGAGGWYDAFVLADGRLVLAVGRLSAGGPAAELTTTLLRGALRGAALSRPDPEAVLAAGHAALALEAPARTAAALVALYDRRTGWLSYARAGDASAWLSDGTGLVELAARPRRPLGRSEPTAAELRTVRLRPGAAVLLQTGLQRPSAALADPAQPRPAGGPVMLLLALDLDGAGPA